MMPLTERLIPPLAVILLPPTPAAIAARAEEPPAAGPGEFYPPRLKSSRTVTTLSQEENTAELIYPARLEEWELGDGRAWRNLEFTGLTNGTRVLMESSIDGEIWLPAGATLELQNVQPEKSLTIQAKPGEVRWRLRILGNPTGAR